MNRTSTCSCGQLKLMTDSDPTRVSICHCLACQKRTASVFGVQARFTRSQVVTTGNSNQWTRMVEDGEKITYHFCPTCGSTVFWFIESLPDLIGTGVGSFADSHFPTPTVAVFEFRKHPWVDMPDLKIEHFDKVNQ